MPRKNETHSTEVGCCAPPTGAMTLMSMDEETLSKRRSGTAQWDSSVDRDPQLHARPHLTCAAPTVHINAFKKRAMRLKSCWSAEGHPSALGQILHLSQGGVCSHATSAAASSIFAFAYCCKSRKVRGCTRRILATAPRQRNWRKFEQRCLHEIPWRQHRGNELALPVPLRASAQGL